MLVHMHLYVDTLFYLLTFYPSSSPSPPHPIPSFFPAYPTSRWPLKVLKSQTMLAPTLSPVTSSLRLSILPWISSICPPLQAPRPSHLIDGLHACMSSQTKLKEFFILAAISIKQTEIFDKTFSYI